MQNGKEKRRYFVMGKQNKENQNNIKITLEQHQNNIRTILEQHQNNIRTILEQYQNNIRTISEQYQNNFRTTSLPDNGMRPLQHRHTNAGLSEYAYKLK